MTKKIADLCDKKHFKKEFNGKSLTKIVKADKKQHKK